MYSIEKHFGVDVSRDENNAVDSLCETGRIRYGGAASTQNFKWDCLVALIFCCFLTRSYLSRHVSFIKTPTSKERFLTFLPMKIRIKTRFIQIQLARVGQSPGINLGERLDRLPVLNLRYFVTDLLSCVIFVFSTTVMLSGIVASFIIWRYWTETR